MAKELLNLVLLSALLAGCHGKRGWEDGPLGRRFRGPVQIVLTAAIVAPGKDSGQPWDGPGTLPPEVVQGLREAQPRGFTSTLFRALADGTGVGTLGKVLPWTANAALSGIAAPDVVVEISLNGRLLKQSEMISDSYTPTWAREYTGPVEIGENDQLELRAIDKDLGSRIGLYTDDQIGVCTSQGMPWVDKRGYVVADTFQCHGQLWAVALRIVPAGAG